MKITHNKVGQNLNLVDGAKSDRAELIKGDKNLKASNISPLDKSGLGAAKEATRVDVSPRGQEAMRIKALADAVPDVDMAKVEKYRKLVDEGRYKIDSMAVADKMVDEHLEMLD